MDVRKKRRSSFLMSHSKNLPDDIIGHILSWLPVKCVLRCRCVCKSWQIITHQKSFIEKHQRNKCPEIVYEYEDRNKLDGDDRPYIFESYCKGLVLEFHSRTHEFRVRNPATKQVIQLPAVSWIFQPILCFDSSTGNYKIFCLLPKQETIPTRRRRTRTVLLPSMLTIGNNDDLAWRSQDIRMMCRLDTVDWAIWHDDVCYTFRFCLSELNKTDIFRFTMDGKTWMKINIPQSFRWELLPKLQARNLQVFILDDDKLSIGFIVGVDLHLWVLENCNEHIWSEKKLIRLDFIKNYPNPGRITVRRSPSLAQLRVIIANHYVEYDIDSKKYTCLATAPPGQHFFYELTPSLAAII